MAKTILLVEDDQNLLKLTKDMLDVAGYTTIMAIDGRQGVEFAKTIKPDLVLMDIMMPVKDGYTACTEIKNDPEIGQTPVIMMSVLESKLNKTLAGRLGANAYLTKPFSQKELISTIEIFLRSAVPE
jgi:two-component system alkaline phosphatase synthesis response regulator PhoP